MANLKMSVWNRTTSSWDAVDITALKFGKFKMKRSYSRPSELTWVACASSNTTTFGSISDHSIVRFWDQDEQDVDGDATHPLFIGHVVNIEPGDGPVEVSLRAIDPSGSGNFHMALNGYDAPATASDEPQVAADSTTRVVYNSAIEIDPDYSFSRLIYSPLGTILVDAFSIMSEALKWDLAADPTGVVTPYDTAQTNLITYIPQQKVVATEETLRSFVRRMLNQYQPNRRLVWRPDYTWQMPAASEMTTQTINVGDWNSEPYPVTTARIGRGTEDRFTRVRITGPQAGEIRDLWTGATTQTGAGHTGVDIEANGLTPIDTGLQTQLADTTTITVYNTWQITDPTIRDVVRLLDPPFPTPVEGFVVTNATTRQVLAYTYVPSLEPVFLASFPAGDMGGSEWIALTGWRYNPDQGIIYFPSGMFPHRYDPDPAGTEAEFQPPDFVRFVYATPGTPAEVVYPANDGSGNPVYAGTAFTETGVERTLDLYEEHLALLQTYSGAQITVASRLSQVAELAERIHDAVSTVVYEGDITLFGLDYTYRDLGVKVNLLHYDRVTSSNIDQGYGAIEAVVDEVRYDFEEGQTQISFTNDKEETLGFSREAVKEEIGISALEIHRQRTANARIQKFRFANSGLLSAVPILSITDTTVVTDANRSILEVTRNTQEGAF